MQTVTQQQVDPGAWSLHRYGLPRERWEALRGRFVWITGAGSGFGRSIAVGLASAGARVILTGRRIHKLRQTVEQIARLGLPSEGCQVLAADISDADAVEQACGQVRKRCDRLYGLVNNAALPCRPEVGFPLIDESVGRWESMFATNVTGPWLLTRSILSHMSSSGGARILFISSEAAWASSAGLGIYNVTKSALNSLSHSLAEECAVQLPDHDLQINTLVPGEARTEMNSNSTESPYSVVSMALILLSHPAGGPSGRFFHRDGRHLEFGYTGPHQRDLLETRRPVRARRDWSQVLETAGSMERQGDVAAALQLYQQIINQDPTNTEALHRSGLLAHRIGRFDVAGRFLQMAIRHDPESAALHLDLGQTLMYAGELEGACAALERCLQLEPENARAHLAAGLVARMQGDLGGCLRRFERARALQPTLSSEIHFHMRLTAGSQSLEGEAERELERGRACMARSDFQQAIEHLMNAVKLNPDHPEVHLDLAHALHQGRQYDLAIQLYLKVLQRDPGCDDARENMEAATQRRVLIRSRLILRRCLAHDGGVADGRCLEALAAGLQPWLGRLAFYGAGRLTRYLLQQRPELRQAVCHIIEEDPALHGEMYGVSVGPLDELPATTAAVFMSNTGCLQLDRMRQTLRREAPELKQLDLGLLEHAAPQAIPRRAMRRVGTIYPIELPRISFEPGQDLILIDLPARMLVQPPNGLAYLHQVLRQEGVQHQLVDLDVVFYHRYHMRRVLDGLDPVEAPGGYLMKTDPWAVGCFTEEWEKPQVVEYFRAEIDEVVQKLVEARPRVLGLSLHQTNRLIAREVIRGVRRRYPEVVVLVGGYDCVYHDVAPHVFEDFDYMCIGEADLTIGPLVKALARGQRPGDLPGVIAKNDTPGRTWEAAPLLQQIDALPFPRYEFAGDVSIYRNHNGYWLMPIMSSRGCSWSRCNFCAECFKFRARDPRDVADEIAWLMDRGVQLFHFNDSDVNNDPAALQKLCDEIVRRGLKPQLIGQSRINKHGTPEFFTRLRAAGFSHLRFGVDGWTDNVLRRQRKGYNMRLVQQNLRAAAGAGLNVAVNIVIGVPGETEQDMDQTIANVLSLRDTFRTVENIHSLMLSAGSAFYQRPEEFGIHFRGDREQIYRQHPARIPDELWYSADPHIDHEVRRQRLDRLCVALHEAGLDVGPYARTMARKLGSSHRWNDT